MSQVTKEILQKELRNTEVDVLNSLLNGEISAVETYNHAIQQVKDTHLIPSLEDCRNSHAIRVEKLRNYIEELGFPANENAGLWGTVANLAEGTASMFGDMAIMTVLAGGEEFGTHEYEDHMQCFDPEILDLVKTELLPYQKATEHITRRLSQIIHHGNGFIARFH